MPRVNIQGVGAVNFPDTMSHDDIVRAIETDILPTAVSTEPEPEAEFAPVEDSARLAASGLLGFGRNAGRSAAEGVTASGLPGRLVGAAVDVGRRAIFGDAPTVDVEKQLQDNVESGLSGRAKAAMDKKFVTEDKDGSLGMGDAWSDPLSYYSLLLKSAPEMLATIFGSKKAALDSFVSTAERRIAAGESREAAEEAAKQAARNAAMQTGGFSEGALAAGGQSNETTDNVMRLPEETLRKHPQYQELLAQGHSPARAREIVAERAADIAFGVAGVSAGALGSVGSRYIGDLIGEGGSRIGRAAKGSTSEFLTEAPSSGLEQFGTNLGVQLNANPDQQLSEGVPNAAVAGGILGGTIGGSVGAASSRAPVDLNEPDAAPSVAGLLPAPARVVFPDGTVAQSFEDVERYLAQFPEAERVQRRAELLGMGQQQADQPAAPALTALPAPTADQLAAGNQVPRFVDPQGNVMETPTEIDDQIASLADEDARLRARADRMGLSHQPADPAPQIAPAQLRAPTEAERNVGNTTARARVDVDKRGIAEPQDGSTQAQIKAIYARSDLTAAEKAEAAAAIFGIARQAPTQAEQPATQPTSAPAQLPAPGPIAVNPRGVASNDPSALDRKMDDIERDPQMSDTQKVSERAAAMGFADQESRMRDLADKSNNRKRMRAEIEAYKKRAAERAARREADPTTTAGVSRREIEGGATVYTMPNVPGASLTVTPHPTMPGRVVESVELPAKLKGARRATTAEQLLRGAIGDGPLLRRSGKKHADINAMLDRVQGTARTRVAGSNRIVSEDTPASRGRVADEVAAYQRRREAERAAKAEQNEERTVEQQLRRAHARGDLEDSTFDDAMEQLLVQGDESYARELLDALDTSAIEREDGGPVDDRAQDVRVSRAAPNSRRAQRNTPPRSGAVEVAGNPADPVKAEHFNKLNPVRRGRITNKASSDIVKLFDRLGLSGRYTMDFMTGGYLGRTNPSINIAFDRDIDFGAAENAMVAAGVMLDQQSVVVTDESVTSGNDVVAAIVAHPSRPLTIEETDAIYRRMYTATGGEIDKQGPSPFGGFSSKDGDIHFLNFTELSNEEFHDIIDRELAGSDLDIEFRTGIRLLKSKLAFTDGSEDNGKSDQSEAGPEQAVVWRGAGWFDSLQAESRAIVARETEREYDAAVAAGEIKPDGQETDGGVDRPQDVRGDDADRARRASFDEPHVDTGIEVGTTEYATVKRRADVGRLDNNTHSASPAQLTTIAQAVADVVRASPWLKNAADQILGWGVNDGIWDRVADEYDGPLARHWPGARVITVRSDVLNDIASGDKQLAQAVRGYIAHEIVHRLDTALGDGNMLSNLSPRLAITVDAHGIPQAAGDIAAEAIEAFARSEDSEISLYLRYPLNFKSDVSSEPEFFYRTELFAQLGRLYTTNPALLKKELPRAYSLFEQIAHKGWNPTTAGIVSDSGRVQGEVRPVGSDVSVSGRAQTDEQNRRADSRGNRQQSSVPERGSRGQDGDRGSGLRHTAEDREVSPLRSRIRDEIARQKSQSLKGRQDNAARRSIVNSPAFRRWFGQSKIVDKDGSPKIMYHGTARDIEAFEPKQAKAIFLTDDPDFAETFSNSSEMFMGGEVAEDPVKGAQVVEAVLAEWDKRNPRGSMPESERKAARAEIEKHPWMDESHSRIVGEHLPTRANIMPLYVKAENPFDYANAAHREALLDEIFKPDLTVSADGSVSTEASTIKIEDTRYTRSGLDYSLKRGEWTTVESKKVQSALRELGHDGFYVSEAGRKNLAVYERNQVKSATGNGGAFSDSDRVQDVQSGSKKFSRKKAQRERVAELQAKNVATTEHKKKFKTAYGRKAQAVVDAIDSFLDPLGHLPEKRRYLATRYRTMGAIAKWDEIGKGIYDTLRSASAHDSKAVYDFLTTAGANTNAVKDPIIARRARETKDMIRKVGEALVKRDLLLAEAFEQNKDSYLPRMYLAHLLDDNDFRALAGGRKPSNMGYLKQRKDLSEESRILLGEVKDPAFLSATGITRAMRDLFIIHWLEEIASNEKWVLPQSLAEWKGKRVSAQWLKKEADALRARAAHMPDPEHAKLAIGESKKMDETADAALANIEGSVTEDYRQIPDSPRYGLLRGMWVRDEIHQDLVGLGDLTPDSNNFLQSMFGYGGIGTKATQLWKVGKVALNPATQIRNIVSNMVLLQLSGVALHRLPDRLFEAARQITSKEGKHFEVAKKYGIFEGTFSSQELFRMRKELLDLEERTKGLSALGKLRKIAGAITNGAGNAYQFFEALGKVAKIIDVMEHEKRSEEYAAIEAQKWLFDYSLVSNTVRYARNAPIGAPFLTFMYKVAPRLVEVAAHHPQRFLPWVVLMQSLGMWAVAGLGLDDDDDLEAIKKSLPEYMRDKKHIAVLPYKDEQGRVQIIDLGFFFPWTMFLESGDRALHGDIPGVLSSLGMLGGPVPDAITALTTGKDRFTGRDIADPADPLSRRVGARLAYAYNMAVPPWASTRGPIARGLSVDETDRFGNQKSTGAQVFASAFGVSYRSFDPELSRAENIKRAMKDMRDVQFSLRKKLGDQSLDEKARTELIDEYVAEIEKRQGDLERYMAESQVGNKRE